MRELYLQAEATGWTEPVTEEQIYRVYLSNAPPGKWRLNSRRRYVTIH